MDFAVPDELRDIGEGLVEFVRKVVEPLEEEHRELLEDPRRLYTADGRYAPEVVELRRRVRIASADAGYYNLYGAEELGGAGIGPVGQVYLLTLLHRAVGPGRMLPLDAVAPPPWLDKVLAKLRPEVLGRCLDDLRSGEKTLCFALSEPEAGSDVFSMTSHAKREGDEWILHGRKRWVTNASVADFCLAFVATDAEAVASRTGAGVTGFLVDTSSPGFSVPETTPMMGQLGSDIANVDLDGVRVPADHVIGEVGGGLQVALGCVASARLALAAGAVGEAEWALAKAVEYSRQRVAFGKPIAEQQAVQLLLADSAVDIYAAKNMVWHCAWTLEQGAPARKETSMVKAFCTEMLFRVMDRAINVHGAMGLTNEVRLEAGMRWARLIRIRDGTGEIQRRTIAQRLLRGDLGF